MASNSNALKMKAQYYVWYLGWKECRGMAGREYTEPIVKKMVVQRMGEDLPKMTIELSRKQLKIVQLTENKKGKIQKRKFPSVPARDVTYATQALSPDEDIVACIFLGFNPQTRSAMHAHVYRCDSPETAAMLVMHLNQIIQIPEHRKRAQEVEEELVRKGQIDPLPSGFTYAPSDAVSTRASSLGDDGVVFSKNDTNVVSAGAVLRKSREGSGDADNDVFESVTAELHARFGDKSKAPLLLPARDYDTWHRHRGNITATDTDSRKCMNADLVGAKGAGLAVARRASSGGGDSAKGDSEAGSNRNSHEEPLSSADRTTFSPVERSAKTASRTDDNYSPRQRRDADDNVHNDDDDDDDELQAVSPRWKTTGQVFVPPCSPRATRKEQAMSNYARAPPRPFSPGPHTRDLQNSYLSQNSGFTANYLADDDPTYASRYDNRRPLSDELRLYSNSVFIADPAARRRYNATALGLTGRDEGYRSLDRPDTVPQYYDGAYSTDYGAPPLGGRPADRYVQPGDNVPIDYTVADRYNRRLARASNYY